MTAGRGKTRPTAVGDLLSGVLRSSGLSDGLERATATLEWSDRVGQAIAAVTRVRSVSGSTVFVEVRSSAWLQELTLMKREILKRMNEGRTEKPFERLVFLLAEDGVEGPTQDPASEPARETE